MSKLKINQYHPVLRLWKDHNTKETNKVSTVEKGNSRSIKRDCNLWREGLWVCTEVEEFRGESKHDGKWTLHGTLRVRVWVYIYSLVSSLRVSASNLVNRTYLIAKFLKGAINATIEHYRHGNKGKINKHHTWPIMQSINSSVAIVTNTGLHLPPSPLHPFPN